MSKQENVKPKHPYCQVCGWRKGGVDSWDGHRCKCGLSATSTPVDCDNEWAKQYDDELTRIVAKRMPL